MPLLGDLGSELSCRLSSVDLCFLSSVATTGGIGLELDRGEVVELMRLCHWVNPGGEVNSKQSPMTTQTRLFHSNWPSNLIS